MFDYNGVKVKVKVKSRKVMRTIIVEALICHVGLLRSLIKRQGQSLTSITNKILITVVIPQVNRASKERLRPTAIT